MTEQLKKLAETLRQEVAAQTAQKKIKCAQVIVAATGMTLLKQKLGGL